MSASLAGSTTLSDDQIEHFARQIIVPGIGASGQRRLCAADVFVTGGAQGCRIAAQYLRAAGVRVHDHLLLRPRIDCVVLADARDVTPERLRTLIKSAPFVAWYTIDGRTLRGGLADSANPLPQRALAGTSPKTQEEQLLHRVGGADVATMAVAALLGWSHPGDFYELGLE